MDRGGVLFMLNKRTEGRGFFSLVRKTAVPVAFGRKPDLCAFCREAVGFIEWKLLPIPIAFW